MNQLTKVFKALGDKNRLRIVKMLESRSLCVCEITAVLELATSTVSKHLSILKEAGIIIDKKSGKWVDYQLNSKSGSLYTISIINILKNWLNDDEQTLTDRFRLSMTNREEICSPLYKSGEARG